MLRIALPNKGRLAEETHELFEQAGLAVRARPDRALTASLGGEFEALFVRAEDIPEFVADGAADAGITGHDLVVESGRPLEQLLDLGFGRCRLVVAVKEDGPVATLADLPAGTRVATGFPRTTEAFFARHDRPVTLVPMSGAVEIAPYLGLADVIVDLTSTGSTLRTNGLRELTTIADSSARLVGRPADVVARSPREARVLTELVTALASVLRARDQRYLMANVPRASLDAVKRIVPGMNGPTVIDILNGGVFVAVHAVVQAAAIYRTIADLKALGAEGILVTRIERLVA